MKDKVDFCRLAVLAECSVYKNVNLQSVTAVFQACVADGFMCTRLMRFSADILERTFFRWLCITSWYEISTWWHCNDCLQCYGCSCGIISTSISKYLPHLTSQIKLPVRNYVEVYAGM